MKPETAEVGRELITVRQFSQKYPAWTEASLRNLIYGAEPRLNSRGERIEGNGLAECGALVRVGRRVLIDVRAFFGPWIAEQNRQRRAA
jgi:hypothetical protein